MVRIEDVPFAFHAKPRPERNEIVHDDEVIYPWSQFASHLMFGQLI
jgi:hypothetical protein